MTPSLIRRPLLAGRDGLVASDGGAAPSRRSQPEARSRRLSWLVPRARQPSPGEERALRHPVPSSHLAHHGPRPQCLFNDPRLLVLAPPPSPLDPENLPIHLCVTLTLALRSHPSRQLSSQARRPPPNGYQFPPARPQARSPALSPRGPAGSPGSSIATTVTGTRTPRRDHRRGVDGALSRIDDRSARCRRAARGAAAWRVWRQFSHVHTDLWTYFEQTTERLIREDTTDAEVAPEPIGLR